jgi:hypothetical protein
MGSIGYLLVILKGYTVALMDLSVHPQTASFGPERRFRPFEILDIARYACGFKIAQALL